MGCWSRMDILTFDQFSAINGVPATPPDFPEMHRNPRRPSKASQRVMSRAIMKQMADWQASRDRLRNEYESRKAAGTVREPTRMERLARTAQGEGAAAEAARRILARGV